MGSHRDTDHAEARREFLKELEIRADVMTSLSKNTLQNEKPLLSWEHEGVTCQLLPDDRQKILRISIGGGPNLPASGDYCNIRGDVGACVALLERALTALKACPE